MNEQVMEFIKQGGTLITANNRLAHHLRYQYAKSQIGRDISAWNTPDILPWSAWLKRNWEACSFNKTKKLLLAPTQELALWQQIISHSPYAEKLLQSSMVARRAADAWDLLCQYQLPIFSSDVFISEDAYAFKTWAGAFRKECDARGWVDNASLPDVLIQYLKEQPGVFDKKIALSGFEIFTPQQTLLLEELQSAGTTIQKFSAPKRNNAIHVYSYTDTISEITAAANWARVCLEKDPEASVGIGVPNLNILRHKIHSRFEDILMPGALVNGRGDAKPTFSLSLGKPLSDYPLIDAIFSVFSLGNEPVALANINSLLRTPFIKDADGEKLKRAMLDARLRSHGETYLNINAILYIADTTLAEEERPTRFLHLLKQAQTFLKSLPTQQTPNEWAKHFSDFLKLFAWPGERTPDSDEYQCIQAWQKALARLVSLQMVTPVMNYTTGVSQLRRIARELSFQPETEETPVQVLGLEGTADMAFDYLWIMGLHEENWPPPAQSNPFIPIALQKEFRLPNATADIALSHAKQLLSGLVDSATQVVLSYPENESERILRPSPLLKVFGEREDALHRETRVDYLEQILASREIETFIDEKAPPVAGGEFSSGGTALFKDQSACHFRAFARHRLYAETLDKADIGLDARERGSILHRVMQSLWTELGSQENLTKLGDSELDELITSVVEQTIDVQQRKHPKVFTERFTALEQSRLKLVLHEWLQIEKERAPFTVIATEQAQHITFEDLQVNTRVDRVDELPDGRRIIIDYKTGNASVNEWAGDRPDDPQLPLYAVTHGKDIAALAFARLKRGDRFGYEGLASNEDVFPGVKAFTESRFAKRIGDIGNAFPSWEALFHGWENTLKKLAIGFRDGDARVNPKDSNACLFCDQHTFCRIYELSYLATENTESSEE